MAAKKKAVIQSILSELQEARLKDLSEVSLMRVCPEVSGPDAAFRRNVLFKNFRVTGLWSRAKALVLGPGHPGYCAKPREAATCNTLDLFDHEICAAERPGVSLNQLAAIHQKYFGATSDFKDVMGVELKQFAKDNFEYDEKKNIVSKKADSPDSKRIRQDFEKELQDRATKKESQERAKKAQDLFWLLSDSTQIQKRFDKIWGACSVNDPGTNKSSHGRGMWSYGKAAPINDAPTESKFAPRSRVSEVLLPTLQEYDLGSSSEEWLRDRMEHLPEQLDRFECLQLFQSALFSLQAMHKRTEKNEPVSYQSMGKRPSPCEDGQDDKRAKIRPKRVLDEYAMQSKVM